MAQTIADALDLSVMGLVNEELSEMDLDRCLRLFMCGSFHNHAVEERSIMACFRKADL